MSEIMEFDKGDFERVPGVSQSVEDLRGLTIYMTEAETIDNSWGVLVYIPFASPKHLMSELRGDNDE